MRVCYIGPILSRDAANGGYAAIARSHSRLLQEYANVHKEVQLHLVDSSSILSIQAHEHYDICIVLCHPSTFLNERLLLEFHRFLSVSSQRFLTLFWETTPLPAKWDFLWTTNLFTGFISASNFVRDLIKQKKAFIQKNMQLHYAIENNYPFIKGNIGNNYEKKLQESKFTVLYIGQYTKRKGMEDAVIAFTIALSTHDDCQLILKFHPLSQHEVDADAMIQSSIMCNTKDMKAHVYKITENLDTDGLVELYQKSSLLLACSRGEGLHLPSLEAGCIGIPVLYTEGSAMPEFTNFPSNELLPCYNDTAQGMAQYDYESTSLYCVPYMSSMVEQLKMKYDLWKFMRESYYHESKDNYKLIQEKFGKEVCLEELSKILTI